MIGDETTTLNGELLMMMPMRIGEAPFFPAWNGISTSNIIAVADLGEGGGGGVSRTPLSSEIINSYCRLALTLFSTQTTKPQSTCSCYSSWIEILEWQNGSVCKFIMDELSQKVGVACHMLMHASSTPPPPPSQKV